MTVALFISGKEKDEEGETVVQEQVPKEMTLDEYKAQHKASAGRQTGRQADSRYPTKSVVLTMQSQ